MKMAETAFTEETRDQLVQHDGAVKLLQNELAKEAISLALKEDIGVGDITSDSVIPATQFAKADVVVKEKAVIAGLPVFCQTFQLVDPQVQLEFKIKDGTILDNPPTVAAVVFGPARSILCAERTALNFLQRLSGIASTTKKFVDLALPHHITILDTRKTIPCMRVFEKYAVQIGGGTNHRLGLFDAILVKDNHLRVAGTIASAVSLVRKAHPGKKLEVETTTLMEVEEALQSSVDVILLDNMNPDLIKQAVELINKRSYIEVSGGITLDNLQSFLLPGVDAISIGALTHSAVNIDISLEVTFEP